MTAIPYETPDGATPLPFTDRRPSIRAAGVVLIVLGALSGCVSAMVPVGMFFTEMARRSAPATQPVPVAPAGPDMRAMVPALAVYVLAAVVFIWCGAAALQMRRWVRPVMLVIAWTWVVSGVLGTVASVGSVANYRGAMAAAMPPGSAAPPPQFVYAMLAVTLALTAVFMIALPALLLWFFQRRGVRQTMEYFDPRPRWTDRCPTPVLAVAFWLVLSGAGSLIYLAFGILPLFGRILTGPAAVVGIVVIATLLFALARSIYLLRQPAWWGTVVLVVVMSASMITTVRRLGVEELYHSAGYTREQVDLMTRFGGIGNAGTIAFTAVAGALLIGYLVFVRRYFVAKPAPSAT
jgi:hypothetical protein